jgi:hypothetical protein
MLLLLSVPSQTSSGQQSWLPAHTWLTPLQVGAMQTPLMQLSIALQQGTSVEQLLLVVAQAATAAAQVPLVPPAGTSQARPSQQSALTVQLAPDAWQKDVPVLLPQVHVKSPAGQALPSGLVQVPLQQSVPVAQAPVSSLQLGGDEVRGRQT